MTQGVSELTLGTKARVLLAVQAFDNFTPALPKQSRIAVHGLISY